MSEYTDIKTSHLPDDVVNEEFVVLLSNQATDPENRIGDTVAWKAAAEFEDDGGVKHWGEWESNFPVEQSGDQLEFIARFLGYWSQRFAQWAEKKRSGEFDEEIQSASDSSE